MKVKTMNANIGTIFLDHKIYNQKQPKERKITY